MPRTASRIYQHYEFGIPQSRINDEKAMMYPTGVHLPNKFIIEDAFIQVMDPVEGAKVSVGTESNRSMIVNNFLCDSKGVFTTGVTRDKDGNIIEVTHGPALCNVVTKKEPVYKKSSKTGEKVKTGDKLVYVSYEKKKSVCDNKELYITIPKGCGLKKDLTGALGVKIYITGYLL